MFRQFSALCALSGILVLVPAAVSAATSEHDYIAVEGTDVSIPVSVIAGTMDGPVLALIAGTHGYEYPPILAMHRILKRPELEALRGTLIIVHVANPSSFYGRTIYYNPADGENLNRVFPGDAGGTESQRIAKVITSEVIEKADYLIDLHAGDGNEDLRPFTYMPQIGDADLDRRVRELAIAFGLDHIVVDRATPPDPVASRFTDHTALSRGIPAITTETGGLGSTDERFVRLAEEGVLNVMRHLRMIPGDADMREDVVWLEDGQVVTSPARGLFQPTVESGHAVAENGLLGVLVDEFGQELATIRAPFGGIVNYVVATPPVSEGEPVAMLSRIRGQ
jgi:predicted deacylase